MGSVRRVAQKVSKNSESGVKAFTTIGYQILEAGREEDVTTLFEVLWGQRPLSDAQKLMPDSEVLRKYSKTHYPKDWEDCGHWVDWWVRERHLSKFAS